MVNDIDQNVLRDLYAWVDTIPLSRPKRNISRDFSDGVLVAEVIKYYFPRYVELHMFPNCNKIDGKRNNWQLLNWKVFSKFSFKLTDDVIESLISAQAGTIEKLLLLLRSKFQEHENGVEPHDNKYLPSNSSRVSISTSAANLPKLRRIPSIRNENSNIENMVPFVIKKPPIAQVSPIKNGVSTKSQNGIRREISFNNGFNEGNSSSLVKLYEQKVQECMELQETIEILSAKLRHMQHLVQFKDMQINELHSKLKYFTNE